MSPPDQLQADQLRIADRVIASLAGDGAHLRPDQLRAVAALTRPGARVLVVQATGWGKSAVYWTATAIGRASEARGNVRASGARGDVGASEATGDVRASEATGDVGASEATGDVGASGRGPTLIVSPLLSLMRDQVAAAERAGLRAATLNSSNFSDWEIIENNLRTGDLDVLLVSPERLANPGFGRRVLDNLSGRLGLLVIDEAHAISDWGHDFRPDYRRVADVLRTADADTPVLATTATANARVTADVAGQLGPDTLVLRGPLARNSLHLNVIDGLSPMQRYAWTARNLSALPGSGIVYVLTVADADRLVEAIRAVQGPDYPVAAYTGQLDADRRHALEDALLRNEVKALVATSALGMGYDKPDLGFVVHVGAPASPVSYYQQVGRAGRALDSAVVVLLSSAADDRIWEYFATSTIPDPEQMTKLLDALNTSAQPQSVPALESSTGLRRNKVDLMLKQLAVDGATERTPDGWVSTGREWYFDAEHYDGVIAVRRREADIMRAYVHGNACLMTLLTESLDDPQSAPCGRCSVCRGGLTDGLPAGTDDEDVRSITATLRRSTLILEPRKMWPGSILGAPSTAPSLRAPRGRIPAQLMAEPGRVLAHADAPEWTDVLAGARNGDDGAVTELADAAVATLARWGRESGIRPDVIVSLRLTGTGIAETLAARLRKVGRRDGGAYPVGPGEPPSDATGAVEAAYWRGRLTDPPAAAGQTVLLVVDATTSGWPITIAAAALREAGATAVLPLLIHRTVG
ncbi:MAG: RecQ family ATP-dependent DNA helicase [Gordonia sp.]|uniref:RecQ family ATP-dependent DNA helicase n=1 Tax=Gordonia sp. (in: high G+C Gram-positive bacteria) TaxID=84139 RepID=UPI001DB297DB|nr:DEAD/DEAH box helicase [Gordonia sp. (in: high G+C Gram-positive bacteria)]MCB1296587.1 RecQ family ATP-dependent DNA helicase [Gordonia sp. (in: high G+C Gram-positive bacteria)]